MIIRYCFRTDHSCYSYAIQFPKDQRVEECGIFGSALSVHVIRAVSAQVVDAAYKFNGGLRFPGELSFDKGHVPHEFLAVTVTCKSLQAEQVVRAQMKDSGWRIEAGLPDAGGISGGREKCCIARCSIF